MKNVVVAFLLREFRFFSREVPFGVLLLPNARGSRYIFIPTLISYRAINEEVISLNSRSVLIYFSKGRSLNSTTKVIKR